MFLCFFFLFDLPLRDLNSHRAYFLLARVMGGDIIDDDLAMNYDTPNQRQSCNDDRVRGLSIYTFHGMDCLGHTNESTHSINGR